MEHMYSSNEHSVCCSSNNNAGVRQSLHEMEFERGIWYAAQCNDMDRVKLLLEKGVSANAEDSAGYTALHYAARNGHYQICKTLLENGATINAQTRCGCATALHRAARQGHIDIVELLIKFGANANLKDADGYIALHKALDAGSIIVSKFLVTHTNLILMIDNRQSLEKLANEKCPGILSVLATYMNADNSK